MTDEAIRNGEPDALLAAARSSLGAAHVHLVTAMQQLYRADVHRQRALQAAGSFEEAAAQRTAVVMGDVLDLYDLLTPQCSCGQRHAPPCAAPLPPASGHWLFGGATLIPPVEDES